MLKKQNQKGFTIIEVLIVLAIAALIMLVVFLAVPALRRNAANSGRDNDAAKISAAVTDCLTNHNGIAGSCQAIGAANVDVTSFAQLTGTIKFNAAFNAATPAELTADTDGSVAVVSFKSKCLTDGSGQGVTSTNSRDFIVQYNKKSSSGVNMQCIGS